MAKSPTDEYFRQKEAAKAQRKADELTLWHAWKEGGEKPKDLQPLLRLYESTFALKTQQWKPPSVPVSAFKAELRKRAVLGFQSYDPARGAALKTHIDNSLKRALRYGNRGANLLYIPEGQAAQVGAIQRAQDMLTEDLGRSPTVEELSQHLQSDPRHRGLTPRRVQAVLSSMTRAVPASRAGEAGAYDYRSPREDGGRQFEDQQIAVAQNILPELFPGKPEMHELFHLTFGTEGRPRITATSALARRLGKTDQQVSRMKTQMGSTLRRHMGVDDAEDD